MLLCVFKDLCDIHCSRPILRFKIVPSLEDDILFANPFFASKNPNPISSDLLT